MTLDQCKPGALVTKNGKIGIIHFDSTRRPDDNSIRVAFYSVGSKCGVVCWCTAEELTLITEQDIEDSLLIQASRYQVRVEQRKIETQQWRDRMASHNWNSVHDLTIREVAGLLGWNTEDES